VAGYSLEAYFQVRQAWGPRVRPDGQALLFLTTLTGSPQLWEIPIEGGWPEQRTVLADRVLHGSYAPHDGRIVFAADHGGDERWQLFLLDADGTTVRPIAVAPGVIHTFGAWHPSGRLLAYATNARHPAYFDVVLLDIESGERRVLIQADGTYTPVAFTPDGQTLIVHQTVTPRHHVLHRYSLATGTSEPLTSPTEEARYEDVQLTPDGATVVVLSDRGREFLGILELSLNDGHVAWRLTRDDADIETASLSPDGRLLAYAINEGGYSRLRILDRVNGVHRPDPLLPQGLYDPGGRDPIRPAWTPDSRAIVIGWGSATAPADIWRVDIATGIAQPVTHSSRGGLPADAFTPAQLIHYPTFDGRQIPAFFYRPTRQPFPVVVHVHGGPEAQARPSFDPLIQWLVSQGIGVLAPNVRGSAGYGRTYLSLDDVEKRPDAVRDLLAARDWLAAQPEVRSDRIAVMGASYGGFMTLAALTEAPEAWACGVEIVGIVNFITFLERTGPWRRRLREAEYGSLEHDRAFLESISPITRIDRITAPLMVIHGRNDPRVPFSEAEQLVAALRDRGRDVLFLPFDDEGHGIVKLANRLRAYREIGAFLARHLLDEGNREVS